MRFAWLVVIAMVSAALAAACGDDSTPNKADAAVDAGPDSMVVGPDAAYSNLFGDWRFKEVIAKDDGGTLQTIGPNDTTFTDDGGVTQTVRVSGRFSLSADVFSLSFAGVLDGRLNIPGASAEVQVVPQITATEFDLPANNVVPYTLSGDNLILTPTGFKITLERLVLPAKKDTLELKGVVTLPTGAPIAKPRLALAFVLRGSATTPNAFIVPPNGAGDTNDMALGTTAMNPGDAARSFDLSRTGPPLGVERITYGNAGASLGFVVLYDDKNGNGKLDDLYDTTPDEIRGATPVAAIYRVNDDPELRASRLRYVPPGWSQGTVTTWFTISDGLGNGIGPLDPTTKAVPVDVEATPAATASAVPVGSQLAL